ncbi:transcriptional regulator [Bacteroidia bacterium]|nr:transcriptional regulator [Bacteroidia bacterium]
MNKELILNRVKQSNYLASDKELADFLGISKSTLSNWYKRNSIDYDLLFSKCEQIDKNWLLTGQGEMLRSEKKPEVKEYDIDNSGSDIISEPENKVVEETVLPERKLIPFFDAIVQAGTQVVADMNNDIYPVELVDAGDFFQDATAVMAVHGDSMFPDYRAGSLIAIKEVNNKRLIIPGNDYVVETSEYRVIKRLKQNIEDKTCWIACSTNMEKWDDGPFRGQLIHEPFEVPIDEILHLYLVLGKIERNHSSKISKL